MSNSIWKTDCLREASTKKLILYFAGGSRIPYTGWNHPDIMMLSASNESWWNYTDVMRWCYVDDIIAQADRAERLEKENEAMRQEFEVWYGNYKCEVEEKKRLQKAVEALKEFITKLYLNGNITDEQLERYKNTLKRLIKDE